MSHADPQVSIPPVEAFRFASPAKLHKKGADGRRKFDGVAYSGEMIKSHWFWGNLVFDIGSTKAGPSVPALLEHDSKAIAGSGVMSFSDEMRIEGLLSAKTEAAKHVADQADEDFPWQMSVFIEPGEIDQVAAGVKFKCNGRDFVGPATVFKNSLIREVSFCATGADANTSATVFSKGQTAMTTAANQPSNAPTIESLTADVARLTAEVSTFKARAETAEAESAAVRKVQLTQAFKACGMEVTDEKLAPYLSMNAAQFAATLPLIVPTRTAANPKLFTVDGENKTGENGPVKSSLVERAGKLAGAKS